ncbi:hypothetical protein SAMN04487950_1432 [Halogranum rubrum]|uniref:CARDB protein n=1 Tax=Halogranum rubrum TaxID=553466 RepID=A0A1I4CZ11_9EURY|nr:hypothetical protein [Halogranum rubrum]SFK85186.1 hypothetical protein SAMN04487950_1432 [Halogranum rubrum]
MSERNLPPLLAMDDELDRLERKADGDIGTEVGEIRDRLDEFETRETSDDRQGDGRDSLLDDVDGILLRLRERLSGEADRQAEALQNRVRQFRESRAGQSDTLSLAEPRLEQGGTAVDIADRDGQQVDVRATLVNAGEASDGVVRVAFYDGDGRPVRRVDLSERTVDGGEKRDVAATVSVPPEAMHYDVSVVDAESA